MLEIPCEFVPSAKQQTLSNTVHGMGQSQMIRLKTNYSYEAVNDYGRSSRLIVAYVSDNNYLGNIAGFKGEKDNAVAKNNSQTAMAVAGKQDLLCGLTGKENPTEQVVYGNASASVTIDRYDFIGISKRVSVLGDEMWTNGISNADERNTYPGGAYTYKIRTVFKEAPVRDAVIYDVLDSYKVEDGEDAGDVTWKGNLLNIDTSSLIHKGIDPVIYYSTNNDIALSTNENMLSEGFDISNTDIWTTDRPAGKITAVAIDLSHKDDGSDYIMEPGDSAEVRIEMLAPSIDEFEEMGIDISDVVDTPIDNGATEADGFGAHAYNSAFFVGTIIDNVADNSSHCEILQDFYTKVGVLPYSISVSKTWDDAQDNDKIRPDKVVVDVIREGKVIDTMELSGKDNWTSEITGIYPVGATGVYAPITLSEHIPDGYVPSYKSDNSETNSIWTIDNFHALMTTTVSGTKTWEGNNPSGHPSTIQLKLMKNGSFMRMVTLQSPSPSGQWTTPALQKYDNGIENVYTVEEIVPDMYYADVDYSNGLVNITNTYHPYGNIVVGKTLEKSTSKSSTAKHTFTFSVSDKDGPYPGSWTVKIMPRDANEIPKDAEESTVTNGTTFAISADEKAVIENVPVGLSYSLIETPAPGYTPKNNEVTGIVECTNPSECGIDSANFASFTNTYAASGSISLSATKVLSGTELTANKFRFELKDENGELIRMGSNSATGEVRFSPIEFSLEDLDEHGVGEKTYTITEMNLESPGYTYDEHEETVRVSLIDKGNGHIAATASYDSDGAVFKNTYEAQGSVPLRAYKSVPSWKEIINGFYDQHDYLQRKDPKDVLDGLFLFEASCDNLYQQKASVTQIGDVQKAGSSNIDLTTGEALRNMSYSSNTSKTISFPGANQIKAKIWISQYSTSYSWATLYPTSILPSSSNYGSSLVSDEGRKGKINGTSRKTTKSSITPITLTYSGIDSLKSYYYSSSYYNHYYGYYAEFTGFRVLKDETYKATASNDRDGNIDFGKVNLFYGDTGETYDIKVKEVGLNPNKKDEIGEELYNYLSEQVRMDDHEAVYSVKITGKEDGQISYEASYNDTNPVFENTFDGNKILIEKYVNGDYPDGSEFTYHVELNAPEGEELPIGKTDIETTAAKAPFTILYDGNGRKFADGSANGVEYKMIKYIWDGNAYVPANPGADALSTSTDNYTLAGWKDETGNWVDVDTIQSDATLIAQWVDAQQSGGVYAYTSDNGANFSWAVGKNGTLSLWGTKENLATPTLALYYKNSFLNAGSGVPWYNQREFIKKVDVLTDDINIIEGYEGIVLEDDSYQGASSLFHRCKMLSDISALENWDMSNISRTSDLFSYCSSLKDISPIANWNMSLVEDIHGMFSHCGKLSDIGVFRSWHFADSGLRSVAGLFDGCYELSDISPIADLPVSQIKSLERMFRDCKSLENIAGISGWDVSQVNNTSSMFENCSIASIGELASWGAKLPSLSNTSKMFKNANNVSDFSPLYSWNMSENKNVSHMFDGCFKIEDISFISDWNLGNGTDATGILSNCYNISTLKIKNDADKQILSSIPLEKQFSTYVNITNNAEKMIIELIDIKDSNEIGTWKILPGVSNIAAQGEQYYYGTCSTAYDAPSSVLSDFKWTLLNNGTMYILPNKNREKATIPSFWLKQDNNSGYYPSNPLPADQTDPWNNIRADIKTFKSTVDVVLSPGYKTDTHNYSAEGIQSQVVGLFENTSIADLSCVSSWNTENMGTAMKMFSGCKNITTLDPVSNWTFPASSRNNPSFWDSYADYQSVSNSQFWYHFIAGTSITDLRSVTNNKSIIAEMQKNNATGNTIFEDIDLQILSNARQFSNSFTLQYLFSTYRSDDGREATLSEWTHSDYNGTLSFVSPYKDVDMAYGSGIAHIPIAQYQFEQVYWGIGKDGTLTIWSPAGLNEPIKLPAYTSSQMPWSNNSTVRSIRTPGHVTVIPAVEDPYNSQYFGLFQYCYSLSDISAIADWDFSQVRTIKRMFYNSGSNIRDLSPLNAANIENINFEETFGDINGAISVYDPALSKFIVDNKTPGTFYNTLKFQADVEFTNESNLTSSFTSIVNNNMPGTWTRQSSGGIPSTASGVYEQGNASFKWTFNSGNIEISPVSGDTAIIPLLVPTIDNVWYDSTNTDAPLLISFIESFSIKPGTKVKAIDKATSVSKESIFSHLYMLNNIEGLKEIDTSAVTSLSGLFSGDAELSNISALSNWNTSNVNTCSNLFENTSITDFSPISNWGNDTTSWSSAFNKIHRVQKFAVSENTSLNFVQSLMSAASDDTFNCSNGLNNVSAKNISNAASSNMSEIIGEWENTKNIIYEGEVQQTWSGNSPKAVFSWYMTDDNVLHFDKVSSLYDDIGMNISADTVYIPLSYNAYNGGQYPNVSNYPKLANVTRIDFGDNKVLLEPVSSANGMYGSFRGLFEGFKKLTDVSAFAKENVKIDNSSASSFAYLNIFKDCTSLEDASALSALGLGLSYPINKTSYLFSGCESLNDLSFLSGWNISPNITSTWSSEYGCDGMFDNCSNISKIKIASGDDTLINLLSLRLPESVLQSTFKSEDGSIEKPLSEILSSRTMGIFTRDMPEVDSAVLDYGYYSNTYDQGNFSWKIYHDGSIVLSPYGSSLVLPSATYSYSTDTNSVNPFAKYASMISQIRIDGNAKLKIGQSGITGLFANLVNLTDISDLNKVDTTELTRTNTLFSGCSSLSDISALRNWNMDNVITMSSMFDGCSALNDITPISNWNTTSCQNMASMFHGTSLSTLEPLGNWNTANVTNMSSMFSNIPTLSNISAIGNWNMSKTSSISSFLSGSSSPQRIRIANKSTYKKTAYNSITNKNAIYENEETGGLTTLATIITGWKDGNYSMFKPDGMGNIVHQGVYTQSDGNFSWGINDNGTLFIWEGTQRGAARIPAQFNTQQPWNAYRSDIRKIESKSLDTIIVASTSASTWNSVGMLEGCTNLTDISDMRTWSNTSSSWKQVFSDCISLTDITALGGIDLSTANNWQKTFNNCPIEKFYISANTPTALVSVMPNTLYTNTLSNMRATPNILISNLSNSAYYGQWEKWHPSNEGTNLYGYVNTSGSDYTWYVEENELHFGRGTQDHAIIADGVYNNYMPWVSANDMIQKIVNDDNVEMVPATTSSYGNRGLFSGLSSLIDISALANWDMSTASNISYMFSECAALEDVSCLSSWSSATFSNISYLFHNCSSLRNIAGLNKWKISGDCNSVFKLGTPSGSSMNEYSPIDTFTIDSSMNFSLRSEIVTAVKYRNNYSGANYNTKVFRDAISGRIIAQADMNGWYTDPIFEGEWSPYIPDGIEGIIASNGYVKQTSASFGWGVTDNGELHIWSIREDGTIIIPLYWTTSSPNTLHQSTVPWNAYVDNIKVIRSHGQATVTGDSYSNSNVTTIFSTHKNLEDISETAEWSFKDIFSARLLLGGCHNLKDISAAASWKIEPRDDIAYHALGALPSDFQTLTINDDTSNLILAGVEGPILMSTFTNESGENAKLYEIISTAFKKRETVIGKWTRTSDDDNVYYAKIVKDKNSDLIWKLDHAGILSVLPMYSESPSIAPSYSTFTAALAEYDTCTVPDIQSNITAIGTVPDVHPYIKDLDRTSYTAPLLGMSTPNLVDISGLAEWNFCDLAHIPVIFGNAPKVTDITSISNWNIPPAPIIDSAALSGLTGCTKIQIPSGASTSLLSMYNTLPGKVLFASFSNGKGDIILSSAISGNHAGTWTLTSPSELDVSGGAGKVDSSEGIFCWRVDSEGLLHLWSDMASSCTVPMMSSYWESQIWRNSASNVKGIAIGDPVKITQPDSNSGLNFFSTMSNIEHLNGIVNWDTTEITNMSNAFCSANNLSDITGLYGQFQNVTSCDNMFGDNINIRKIKFAAGDNRSIYQQVPGAVQQMRFSADTYGNTLQSILSNWITNADKVWESTVRTYDLIITGSYGDSFGWGVSLDQQTLYMWTKTAAGTASLPQYISYHPWALYLSQIKNIVLLSNALISNTGSGSIGLLSGFSNPIDVTGMGGHLVYGSDATSIFGSSRPVKFKVTNSYDYTLVQGIANSYGGTVSATSDGGAYRTFSRYSYYSSDCNGTWTVSMNTPYALSYEPTPLDELATYTSAAFTVNNSIENITEHSSIQSVENKTTNDMKIILGTDNSDEASASTERSNESIFSMLTKNMNISTIKDASIASTNIPESYNGRGADLPTSKLGTPEMIYLHSNTEAGIVSEIAATEDTVILPELTQSYKLGKVHTGWTLSPSQEQIWAVGDEVMSADISGKTLYAVYTDGTTSIDISSGDFYVTIPANSSITLPKMPAGTSYKITEILPPKWTQERDYNSAGTVLPGERIAAAFSNTYTPDRTSALLYVDTQVSGQPDNEAAISLEGFKYKLTDIDGNVVSEEISDRFGSVTFSNLYFTEPGQYTYTIESVHGDDEFITYDDSKKTINILVEMNDNGDLIAIVDQDKVSFEHSLNMTRSFTVENKIDGTAPDGAIFTYLVTLSDGTNKTVSCTASSSKKIDIPFSVQVASVEIVDEPDGFSCTEETLSTDETNTSRHTTLAKVLQPFYSSVMPEFCDIYKYDNTENIPETDENGYSTIISKSHVLTFTHEYKATGSYQITATKKLDGASLSDYAFIFDLKNESGDIIDTAAPDKDGNIVFDLIQVNTLPQNGIENYTISEREGTYAAIVYDLHEENVSVSIEDNGRGQYTCNVSYDNDGAIFTNRYFQELLPTLPSYTAEIDMTSELGHFKGDMYGETTDNSKLTDKKFNITFDAKDIDGNALSAIHYIMKGKQGEILMDSLMESGQTLSMSNGEKILFDELVEGDTVSAQQSATPAWSTSHTQSTAQNNNNDGPRIVHKKATISYEKNLLHMFNTYYAEGSWSPEVKKVFNRGSLFDGMFSFVMHGDDGTDYTATCDADGNVSFPNITMDSASGITEKTYEISEITDPNNDEVTFDESVYTVTVTAGEIGEENLDLIAVINKDGEKVDQIVFTNTYSPSVSLPLTGTTDFLLIVTAGIILVIVSCILSLRRNKQL